MARVSRIDAFRAVTEAIDSNDIKTANAIFNMASQSIEKDRKRNEYSIYIELNSKQKKLFNGKYSKYIQEDEKQ